MAGALKNALGHGEMLDMGYNSPIAGQEGHTVSAKLFLPSLFRAPVSGTLEAIMDTVREPERDRQTESVANHLYVVVGTAESVRTRALRARRRDFFFLFVVFF